MRLDLHRDWPALGLLVLGLALLVPDPMLQSAAVHAAGGVIMISLAVVFLERGGRFPAERRGWRWCALGLGVLSVRWLSAAVATAAFHRPTPAWALALAIPGNLLVVIGLLCMPIAPTGRAGRIRTGLEAFVFGLSALCLMWLAGVAELATFVALPLESRVMAVAPFLMNATIMGTIVYLASPRPGRYLGTLGFMLICVMVATASNLILLTRVLGGTHGADPEIRAAAMLAVGVLAWGMSRIGPMDDERYGPAMEPLGGLVPMLPTLGLLGVLLVRHATGSLTDELPLMWLVYPLVGTLLVRQVLALEDVRLLSASLEAKVAQRSAALADAQDQLQRRQRLEGLGRLAGGVAHDFNNLLTGISGYAHLVTRRVPAGGEAAGHAAEIRRAVERGAGLTRQILTFASRQPGEPQVIVPAQIVGELAQMLGRVVGAEVQLSVDPAATALRVRMDPAQLEQVVVNLATNAHEAMPKSGRVAITVSERVLGATDHETLDAAPGRYVTVEVADDGVGMSPAVQAHLFEPFFTTKPRGTGAGLGLATSYGIVGQARGFFNVVSDEGRGSRFTVHLPVWTDEAAATGGAGASGASGSGAGHTSGETTPTPSSNPSGSGVRSRRCVLLVDDSPALRTTLATALKEQGYAVLVAATGEEGVSVAEQHAGVIDVLVSDIVMPGMDGVATARAITALRPGLPVILISGFSDTPQERLPREYGFLAKPFAPPALVERIRRATGQRRGGA